MPKYDSSIIPEVLNDFNAYDGDGDKMIGVTNDMTLADIVSKTVEMEGAGLSPIEVVVVGMYNSVSLYGKWKGETAQSRQCKER